ncbi:anti-sigma factor [Bacillus spizizenii]|uniref:anti-sigma factor n=1 Tax=Bacillus spizizenii TaxID=96241 RepID=UPI002DB9772B|nr:anti-sigma factor [Bacillus spizizenii]MEC1436411.1 anti-sigma factor [Bacillus spizizenii]MEC1584859.1 anti-sigma factor [Bacillus spizizenii]
MMNEEFKKRFDQYKNGEMSDQEMTAFEEELEKLEVYQELIDSELEDDNDWDVSISPEKQKAILAYGKRKSYLRISVLAVISTLMILPLCTLGSYLYYGMGGKHSTGNEFMETAAVTVALTMPNVLVDTSGLKSQVKLFGMNTEFPLQKQIGTKTAAVGNERVEMFYDKVKAPAVNYYDLEVNKTGHYFTHPSNASEQTTAKAEKTLKTLPEGTVSEVYLSYDRAYPTKEVYNKFKGYDVSFLWNAIETELNTNETVYTEPLGYPGKDSKFLAALNTKGKSNGDQFINALKFMSKHEKWAQVISKRKDLNVDNRLDYVEKNGVNVYGSVVTGPTKEIQRMLKNKSVKSANVGEVELWNW